MGVDRSAVRQIRAFNRTVTRRLGVLNERYLGRGAPVGALRAASVEIRPARPRSAEARHCLEQYFAELASRFRGGFEPDTRGVGAAGHFMPPKGALLIVWLLGEPVGCGAVRTLEPGVGEIKRMWVSPAVRGLGVGRRLLEALERVARGCKLRVVRLDTNAALSEALRLYRSSGYREIDRFNDNPYAQHWFEKTLRRGCGQRGGS